MAFWWMRWTGSSRGDTTLQCSLRGRHRWLGRGSLCGSGLVVERSVWSLIEHGEDGVDGAIMGQREYEIIGIQLGCSTRPFVDPRCYCRYQCCYVRLSLWLRDY